jgi:hypothetical protein
MMLCLITLWLGLPTVSLVQAGGQKRSAAQVQ